MAKVKMSKKSTRIDMAAMCDVAFLLLTFFIMTSTARLPEPVEVSTPASTVQIKLPDVNIATVTVADGRTYFGAVGQDTRRIMLERMGERYGLAFTEEEKNRFSLIESFGVDISELKSFIALDGADRMKPGVQKGIAIDSLNNQLSDWIQSAREANIEVQGLLGVEKSKMKDIDIAIKGDAKEDYPTIKKVIDILQKRNKNTFYLVTGLRSEDDI
ncbi:MAG: biopolymer transporter ExbD [Bacteroidota bacterium]|nr:biopolymer transporter ExbD [Bacteroidota bacterium]